VAQLTAIAFDACRLKDAFTIVRGNGQRKLAVFEDPNCGYCKRFERDLQKVDNVTVHLYLYPILGADSTDKSRAIWCAKDPAKAWSDWMLRNVTPSGADKAANCDVAALQRNCGARHASTASPAHPR
jgi:thiol:disulfide interchange protein DsbC